jgi:hypothetical protein
MGSLLRLCKIYGSIEICDSSGKRVVWFWDYKQDKPRLRCEMTKEEIAESERQSGNTLSLKKNETKTFMYRST